MMALVQKQSMCSIVLLTMHDYVQTTPMLYEDNEYTSQVHSIALHSLGSVVVHIYYTICVDCNFASRIAAFR
jgi:hypothetical protein